MGTLKKRGLLVPVSILLITGACAVSAWAQIARPVGAQNSQPLAPMASPPQSAPMAQISAPTSPAPAARPTTPAAPQEMLYYVCGNTNIDGHVTSPDPQHPFNLGVTFISSQSGAPLTEVSVKLRRHGRVLMDFVAAGPHCLFAVPEADYRIEGTYRGEMKFEIVQTGTMNAQIKW